MYLLFFFKKTQLHNFINITYCSALGFLGCILIFCLVWGFGFIFEMALQLLGVVKKYLRRRIGSSSQSGEWIDNFMCYSLWIIELFKVYYPFKPIGCNNQVLKILWITTYFRNGDRILQASGCHFSAKWKLLSSSNFKML